MAYTLCFLVHEGRFTDLTPNSLNCPIIICPWLCFCRSCQIGCWTGSVLVQECLSLTYWWSLLIQSGEARVCCRNRYPQRYSSLMEKWVIARLWHFGLRELCSLQSGWWNSHPDVCVHNHHAGKRCLTLTIKCFSPAMLYITSTHSSLTRASHVTPWLHKGSRKCRFPNIGNHFGHWLTL